MVQYLHTRIELAVRETYKCLENNPLYGTLLAEAEIILSWLTFELYLFSKLFWLGQPYIHLTVILESTHPP